MFTGLIEALGTVQHVRDEAAGRNVVIAAPCAGEASVGESIAVNGACLTVIARDDSTFGLQVGRETLARTTLGEIKTGDQVNLERSLRLTDRLGGHLVQGHVDGTGTIAERVRDGEWELLWFQCPPQLAEQMIPKGSVTIDGISLTLVEVTEDRFSVALIPHTLAMTTLGFKTVGARVNLETDIIGKYVMKFLRAMPLK